jgi:chemotaxis protein MotB
MALGSDSPIIIKRIKKIVGGGHHGGAWKVAYADFVTAMMAFFLLMWLINTTSPEQKQGIADYFAPASVSKSTSGAGDILSGRASALGSICDGTLGMRGFIPMIDNVSRILDRVGHYLGE